jgi:hypothetical protein
MERKGNACLGQNIRARHHMARYFWKMHLKPMYVRVTYISTIHDMVRHVRSMLVMVRHVRDMNVWTELLGQGIIWKGT